MTNSLLRKAVLVAAAFLVLLTPLAPLPLVPAQAQAQPRGAPDSFADLAERLLPAVVNISTSQNVRGRDRQAPDMPQFPPGSPFEEFFRDFFDRNRPGNRAEPQQPQRPRRAQSLGSGFVIDASGLVVTNNHVIDGADEINVILSDNTTLRAELVGRDQRTDLALLRVRTDRQLTAVRFGNSDRSRVGDWVLAIGNPFGLGGSVTAGIISARGRDIRQGPYDDFLQTDAAINRGNSGGPLFNMAGEVIGINTAIFSPTGGSIGIGFAIASNLAQTVIAQLQEFGRTRRGWLGVRIQGVTDEIAESIGLREARGAMVASVQEGGPADRARIQAGDVILRFGETDIREMRTLPRAVAETAVGRQVPVIVWRDGRERTLSVTIAELQDEQAAATPGRGTERTPAVRPSEIAGLGITVAGITPELRERFQLAENQRGVVITDVAPSGSAAERVRPGDVILEVAQEPVATPAEVTEKVERARRAGRRNVLMLVEGQAGLRWVPFAIGSARDGGSRN
ncbi:MAG: DegQ family serine endoprotease [Alphaproteobacteria bacterium]|nr:DegQ family serine endoprotease [Alphaproteobacteria bacterium]